MRRQLLGLLAGLVLAIPAAAQDQAAIERVIRQQMDAFTAGDVTTAFDFASPGIQGLFGTPENFGRMVEEGYPEVWRPGDVRFGRLDQSDMGLWQHVFVTDGDGQIHALEYLMEEIEGRWRIAGVRRSTMPELAA